MVKQLSEDRLMKTVRGITFLVDFLTGPSRTECYVNYRGHLYIYIYIRHESLSSNVIKRRGFCIILGVSTICAEKETDFLVLSLRGQSSWLLTHRSQVRFPALLDFLSSSGSRMGSTQPL
jgi:hypothetical protein